MAPMATYGQHSLKRTASQAHLDMPLAKKQVREHVRHHKTTWNYQSDLRRDGLTQDDEAVDGLLKRSISLALESLGFEAAEPEALEAFRAHTEEYMAHFLSGVRQSMLSSRRLQATPQDFLQALHTHQLSLRALLPHLKPPVSPTKSQFPLETQPIDEHEPQEYRLTGPLLDSPLVAPTKAFIPKHFPPLPDEHTYLVTEQFAVRERDPRKIRERATEEGRLGEEALRKLVTAGIARPTDFANKSKKPRNLKEQRDQLWLETMSAVTQEAQGVDDQAMEIDGGERTKGDRNPPVLPTGHLSSTVNAEKQFWRNPKPRRKG